MNSKLGQIRPFAVQLAALDQLKKYFTYSRTIQIILMTCLRSGERSGYLFYLLDIYLYNSKVQATSKTFTSVLAVCTRGIEIENE